LEYGNFTAIIQDFHSEQFNFKETAGSENNSKVYNIFPAVSKYYHRGRTKKKSTLYYFGE
jgi:hypothetical protein